MDVIFQNYSRIQDFEADFPSRKSASKYRIRQIIIASGLFSVNPAFFKDN